MPIHKKKSDFFDTQEGKDCKQILLTMVGDKKYCTEASYSANAELYPDHLIPFVNKHMEYLRNHPSTNPQHYLSNLRLMTKSRLVVEQNPEP
jgi:hypothetical protein